MKKHEQSIIVEEIFNAPVNILWEAITDHSQMIKWYFDNIPEFKPEVGFETQFIVENEGRVFPHIWKVIEAVPNQKITYTWRFEGYPGDSYVTFDLSEADNKTKLTLTVTVLEDFPDDIPEFRRESCIGGWNYFLGENLSNYLNNK
jgi:uncharacterized protein YndB with AHSA1/START domain